MTARGQPDYNSDDGRPAFLAGGGACAALVAAKDWAKTPLGPIERWPQSLRSATALLLRSPVPIVMLWGAEGVMLYNDSYSAFAGGRHPDLLGSNVRDGWPEVADFNDNVMKVGLAGGTLHYRDQELTLHRHGRPERVWMDLDYSPVLDEQGAPAGVICILAETTERVAAERHSAFLLALTDELRPLRTPGDIIGLATARLGEELDASRVFYAEIANGRMTVERDHARGVPSIVGEHSLEAFGPDLLGAYRAGKPVTVQNVESDDRLSEAARIRLASRRVCAFVDVVLFEEKEWVGLLAVQSVTPRIWTPAEESLVQEAGERVKAAIERARAEMAVRESEERHRFRIELGDELRELGSPSEIMAAVAQRIGRHLGVDQANYYLVDGDRFVVTDDWPTAARPGLLGSHVIADCGERTVALLRAGGVLRLDATHGVEGAEAFAEGGVAAVLSVPLHRDGRWAAGLHVYQARPRAWTDNEEALVREIAAQAWAAIERARAEVELRALNDTLESQVAARSAELQLYQSIVKSNPNPILAFDKELRVTAFNHAHADKFRETQGVESWVGQRFPDYFINDERPAITALMERALNGEAFMTRVEFGDPTYMKLHWDLHHSPLRDDQGRVIGASHHAIEVTAQVEAERALAASQEALRQSQKMEAMGQLTGGVAHDFNNLLTPIVGALDMLQRKAIGGEREQRLIAGAALSAERAKTLVQRLLSFARRQPLQAVPVDIARLVSGMGDLVNSTTGPQVKVVVDAPEGLPAAIADPHQVEMALLNLTVNARDAMPEGGTLTISASADSVRPGHRSGLPTGHYICLSFADTGSGMDEATLARAVEPFFSTKGVGKGTGLGLSMVHGLASQLGGALMIQSQPGLGTNVELWLPRSQVAPGTETTEVVPLASPITHGTALLVDDEELVRASTADMLSDLGYTVFEASSAEEAMRLFASGRPFDIVVTDHLMPGMTGVDLARAIQASKPELPVLLVSGYAGSEGVHANLPRLTKPFRKDELAASLASLEAAAGH